MPVRAIQLLLRQLGGAPEPSPRVARAVLAVAVAILVAHTLRYDFVTDDAYISFVYARNLAEHGELVFNLGDRVEGYSNFSWTVLLAALYALGVGPELASRALGLGCGVAALLVTYRLATRALGSGSAWAALPSLLLACSAGFACWTSGGLESQLFVLTCLGALDQLAATLATPSRRRWLGVGAWCGAAALTRPEGLLVTAVVAVAAAVALVARAWDRRPFWRRVRPLWDAGGPRAGALVFAALWLPHLAWRLWYYGWPFPNTYYVKAHGPWQPPELAAAMWRGGGYYLWSWLWQTGLVWVLPLTLWGLLAARWRAVTAPAAALAAAYALYAASVGGDFMGLHRFILPLFPIAALGTTLGLCLAARALARWRNAVALGAGVLVAAFATCQARLTVRSLAADNQRADRGIDPPAFLITYTRDRAAIGRALAPCLRRDDFSIVGGAGAQPYFARMRAIDVFGLVSERVAHEEPRVRARAGHTKWASDALLASLAPTFVFSCYALHAGAAPPPLPCAAPWLARDYELVTLHVPALGERGPYYSFLAQRARRFACAAPPG